MAGPAQTNPDIKAKPARKWRRHEKIWLPTWKDAAGDPLETSGGELPVMPLYEQYAVAVYHFVKFKEYTDLEFHDESDALNTDVWRHYEANQAWISEIHTEGDETIGDADGEEVHYVVRCIKREDGWKMLYPDVGYGSSSSSLTIIGSDTKANLIAFSTISGLND